MALRSVSGSERIWKSSMSFSKAIFGLPAAPARRLKRDPSLLLFAEGSDGFGVVPWEPRKVSSSGREEHITDCL